MSNYAEELSRISKGNFPQNPCKFLRIWSIGGDRNKYCDVMEAMFLRDPDTDGLFELSDVAMMLSKDLEISVSRNDVWKHRKGQCIGCRSVADDASGS